MNINQWRLLIKKVASGQWALEIEATECVAAKVVESKPVNSDYTRRTYSSVEEAADVIPWCVAGSIRLSQVSAGSVDDAARLIAMAEEWRLQAAKVLDSQMIESSGIEVEKIRDALNSLIAIKTVEAWKVANRKP